MVEKRFGKLGMPDIERFENYLPTAFNSELTLLQKVNKIIFDLIESNKLTNEMVDYLNQFIEKFDEKLYKTLEDVLQVWLDDGLLGDIVREAINEEVIDARNSNSGIVYESLKERLDSENNKLEKTTMTVHAHIPKESGNSDCYIVQFNNGKNLLIDTSATNERYSVTNLIDSLNITSFDYCLITHAHRDHFGNLDYLLTRYDFSNCVFYFQAPIDKTRMPESQVTSYETCYQVFNTHNIIPIVPENNSILRIDDETSIRFLNTNPIFFENYYGTTSEFMEEGITSLNNFSVVIEITHQNNRLLFNSDIEKEAQKVLSPFLGKQTFSTVPHHCANRQNNNLFFDTINPDMYYASCGTGQSFTDRIDYQMAKNKRIPIYISRYDVNQNEGLKEFSLFISNGNNIFTNSRSVLLRKSKTTITLDTKDSLEYEINEMDISESLICMITHNVFDFIPESNSAICTIEKGTSQYAKITIFNRFIDKSQKNFYQGNYYNGAFYFSELPLNIFESGTPILTNTDLNDLVIRGVYSSESGTITNTLVNKPSDLISGFRLEVKEMHTHERIVQTIYPNFDGVFYQRNLTSQGWGVWFKYRGEAV